MWRVLWSTPGQRPLTVHTSNYSIVLLSTVKLPQQPGHRFTQITVARPEIYTKTQHTDQDGARTAVECWTMRLKEIKVGYQLDLSEFWKFDYHQTSRKISKDQHSLIEPLNKTFNWAKLLVYSVKTEGIFGNLNRTNESATFLPWMTNRKTNFGRYRMLLIRCNRLVGKFTEQTVS